ncbi:MAG: CapA family protein [Pseudobacter sp.]|uniref:CapA family protein n=1 Tax=Pseudobacter sp. TaxID=2045420 RepID=UPI003F80645F
MRWKAFFGGDLVVHQLPGQDWLSPGLSALLKEHAVRAINFEAPLKGSGAPIRKAGPHLHQHPEAASLAESAGFNLINLANNHIFDYGAEALDATVQSFKNSLCVGAGRNAGEAYALKQMEVNGLKLGFLSYCEAEFGAITLNHQQSAGYAWINHPSVDASVMEAKKRVDVLLVQCHAGVEEMEIPLPEWRERYRSLIRAGADAVIASHPHVPQGWETYMGKPVFYSLGNFYFDAASDHPLWNKGQAVSLEYEDASLVNVKVLALERKGSQLHLSNDAAFQQYLVQLNTLLEEPAYSTALRSAALQLWDSYYRNYYNIALQGINETVSLTESIKRFVKRLLFAKKAGVNHELLLHNIRIESHRWLVEKALEEKLRQ